MSRVFMAFMFMLSERLVDDELWSPPAPPLPPPFVTTLIALLLCWYFVVDAACCGSGCIIVVFSPFVVNSSSVIVVVATFLGPFSDGLKSNKIVKSQFLSFLGFILSIFI